MREQQKIRWDKIQARAIDMFERMQREYDTNDWEIMIQSEGYRKMPFNDFVAKAKERLATPIEFGGNPTTVAKDCMYIIERLPQLFDSFSNRLEDVFRSLLVINEDMDEYIKANLEEQQERVKELADIKDENKRLREELVATKLELENKMEGIEPLRNIIEVRVADIINLFSDFKKCVGDEKEMKKFLPVFQKEIESTKKLIELKQKQIFERANGITREVEAGEEEATTDEEEEFPDDDAVFTDAEDIRPPEIKDADIPLEVYLEAISKYDKPKKMDDIEYTIHMKTCCEAMMKDEEWIPPKWSKIKEKKS